MKRLMDVSEARETCNDRNIWKFVVSTYPCRKQAFDSVGIEAADGTRSSTESRDCYSSSRHAPTCARTSSGRRTIAHAPPRAVGHQTGRPSPGRCVALPSLLFRAALHLDTVSRFVRGNDSSLSPRLIYCRARRAPARPPRRADDSIPGRAARKSPRSIGVEHGPRFVAVQDSSQWRIEN
ncbi:hypothetical protein EVAR_30047_1 [Eumeta japonica]|uniref:Uncharacterized protein n=1 Tax=Eumeta variegata TaxID=151549 RepID=A0A4C1VWV1_EUMVA|nr:hypothetical protein EVAR_30047_1 [Eumeta japonica]